MDYQVVVLGGGPGGYTAAIRCNQYGLKTAVIEKDKLGGTCLNRGCIPTKSMLSSAELLAKIKESEEYGISVSDCQLDINKVVARKNRIVGELVGGLDKLFSGRKIDVFNNFGEMISQNKIKLDNGDIINAENIILATGSEPLNIPAFKIDGQNVITSNEALNIDKIPEKMLVIGGGVVGSEFASMFHDFGCDVTVVEMLKFLVSTEDNQVSRTLQTSFKKKGIKLKLKTKFETIEVVKDGEVKVKFSDGTEESYHKVLVAIGRSVNTTGNGITECGITLNEKGFVQIDEKMKTNLPNIYAIGDITGKLMLAHVAAAQGLVAAAEIAGKEGHIDYNTIPAAIFTTPEIASVGVREQELKNDKIPYKTGRFSFAASGKAKGLGETEGFVKVLTDEKGEKLLGAHIIGPHASDLIQELVLLKANNLPLENLVESVHSHPTLSECVHEASESIFKMAIHTM